MTDQTDPSEPTDASDVSGVPSEPVQAVRAAPADYFLATETITVGLRFIVGDTTYEVVSKPVPIGYLYYQARVRVTAGRRAGDELVAFLRAGERQPG